MVREGDEVHIETDAARGGSSPHVVRWILILSTLAAIVLLSAIWIFGAASQGDVEEERTATGMIQSEESGDDTDGLVIDDADEIEGAASESEVDTPLNTIPNETEADTDLGKDAEL